MNKPRPVQLEQAQADAGMGLMNSDEQARAYFRDLIRDLNPKP